nr:hypothetical protein CFP56_22551 [Quercus suber]
MSRLQPQLQLNGMAGRGRKHQNRDMDARVVKTTAKKSQKAFVFTQSAQCFKLPFARSARILVIEPPPDPPLEAPMIFPKGLCSEGSAAC